MFVAVIAVLSFLQVKSQVNNPTVIEFDTSQSFSFLNGTGFFPFSDSANNKFKNQFVSNPKIQVTFSEVKIPFSIAPAADVQEVGNRILISENQTLTLEYVGARARRKKQYGLSFSGGNNYSFTILTTIAPRVTTSSSSSSSSSGAILSSTSSSSSGIPKSSSSSGETTSGGFVVITSSSSSGSVVTPVMLSNSFSGIWKATDMLNTNLLPNKISMQDNQNTIYTFILCVKNGKLEGTIDGGAISQGAITSQIPITKYQVNFLIRDNNNKSTNIRLNIAGKKRLLATFNNIHSVEARKISLNKSCLIKKSR